MAYLLANLVWKALSLFYGLSAFAVTVVLLILDGSVFRTRSQKFDKQLATDRDLLWNLHSTRHGHHRFYELKNGSKLHYIERGLPKNATADDSSPQNLVIFLHGFPDSWALWKDYLDFPKQAPRAWLIALDLPGHGGSDGLHNYGVNEVMETISEFILAMRTQYLDGIEAAQRRVFIVSHDWGAVIALRLASEAPQLADRFIVCNAVLSELLESNVIGRFLTAKKMLETCIHRLRSVCSIREADNESRFIIGALSETFKIVVLPVYKQILLWHYVFIFQLPWPLPSIYGSLGNYWFLRKAHSHSTFSSECPPPKLHENPFLFASSLGPSTPECRTQNSDGESYGASVLARAKRADGGFFEKIRIYREGLLGGDWEMSIHIKGALSTLEDPTSSTSSSHRRNWSSRFGWGIVLKNGARGYLKAPTTVVWGQKDVALDERICLAGMGHFMSVEGSQILVLAQAGHWVVSEKDGGRVVRECLLWALEEQDSQVLKDRIASLKSGDLIEHKMVVEK
ncbi:MAG: hypothetical protein M1820_001627 [Bogoriella megaspora]|nr:MAG: hypothetical protein M1820_001627 [Bogoriella megaspora]